MNRLFGVFVLIFFICVIGCQTAVISDANVPPYGNEASSRLQKRSAMPHADIPNCHALRHDGRCATQFGGIRSRGRSNAMAYKGGKTVEKKTGFWTKVGDWFKG
ncbi:uncharacterized protein LOC106094408 [Stomoxys calcitrans]|uniref:uncharacterized protein LOC106094408 n=1 Tax=Stomoxys calcitrans TaxID=35570 RepID=UPI0027E2DF1C|nr:uncharacterized protein LOC106094408 [Stomoxys calcitrans]